MSGAGISVWAPDGVGEVRRGEDLAALLLPLVELADGDIVVVTSKVVAKAEGQVRASTREAELPGETRRVVARRGATAIVRNRLGLTMAAAGIDNSNVPAGHVVLLPVDPDGSAARLRAELAERAGVNVGVVISDTAGRAWREGQTDIAIGAAGLRVLESFAGREDAYGNSLVVTAPAAADELAGAAELASSKLGGRPFAVVRGRGDLVLAPGEDGPGARSLIREEGRDFFGYGAREAVLRALAGDEDDRAPFGAPADPEELAAAIGWASGGSVVPDAEGLVVEGADPTALAALAFAYGWRVSSTDRRAASRLRPLTP